MSFSIILQNNSSEKNRLDKRLTTIATMTGTLRTPSSVTDPIILVESSTPIFGANYMTISTFGRSYFINDIVAAGPTLYEIHAHVDVLSSFKSEIRANRGIVARQENNWNLYLNDGTFRVYQNPIVLTKAFPSGFRTQEFVLAVAGS